MTTTIISDGLRYEVQSQTGFYIYTIETSAPLAIDAMIDEHFRCLQTWQSRQPLFMLHHFKIHRPFLTPYFRQRLTDLTREIYRSRITMYSALVFPDKWLFHRATLSGLMQLRHVNHSKQCYFQKYDTGFAWLAAQQK